MPEFIKTAEVIGNILQKAHAVGSFVVEQARGGGWSDLPHAEQPPFTRPQRMAHIEYISTTPLEIPSNITIGEE